MKRPASDYSDWISSWERVRVRETSLTKSLSLAGYVLTAVVIAVILLGWHICTGGGIASVPWIGAGLLVLGPAVLMYVDSLHIDADQGVWEYR